MTAPSSAPGEPIEAGVFNASNQAEDIVLVRNKETEFDDDMEPATKNVPLVDTPADDTLFEVYTWGWDGIDCCAVVSHNQNEPSFKISGSPKAFPTLTYSYTAYLLNC